MKNVHSVRFDARNVRNADFGKMSLPICAPGVIQDRNADMTAPEATARRAPEEESR